MEAVLRVPRLSLSAWILIGLGLGIFTGLFFGEAATALQPVADIYIRLMQMTVLPYLVLALIIGFGQLEAAQARRLAKRAGALLLLTWGLTFGVIAAACRPSFPGIQSASFFSNALVEPGQPFSIPDLYFTGEPVPLARERGRARGGPVQLDARHRPHRRDQRERLLARCAW